VECGDGESPLSIAEATTRGSSTLTAMKSGSIASLCCRTPQWGRAGSPPPKY